MPKFVTKGGQHCVRDRVDVVALGIVGTWEDLVGGAKTGSGADGDKMGEGSERLMDRWHRAPSLFAESGKRHKVFLKGERS